jgi:hypothetical protein
MAELTLANDMRVGFLGFTGSGKTYCAEKLLENQPRVVVVDPKGRVNWPGYHLTTNPSAALLEPKTIFRPKGAIPNNFWVDCKEVLHENGGGIVYIDELAVITTPHTIPAGLRDLFNTGRELGVGVWFAAQAASEIPNTALRGSNVLVLFVNVGASDRDKIMKIAGDIGEITAHLDMREFVVVELANRAYDPDHIPVYTINAADQ